MSSDLGPCRAVTLLGSTGSIGTQAITFIQANPQRYRVVGLSAGGSDLRQIAAQAVEQQAEVVAVALDKDITNISGATLSCRSLSDGVKRLLALQQVALSHGG